MSNRSHCHSVAVRLRRKMYFNDKVVIITGASSGIGAACAVNFAKTSALLSLVGRNVNNLTKVALQCKQINGINPLVIPADVSSHDDIKKIVQDTVNHYGRIDILVNNAGVSSIAGSQDKISAYDYVIATNLRGTYLLTNEALPHLIKTKGNIVNVSSVLSNKPLPIMTPYCMSKAAVDMFTKCAALELGPQGVRVNAVNPGPVKTELFKRGGMSDAEADIMFSCIEVSSPLKRLTKGDDVAELVMFLASDKASCITGCCYIIDSGLLLGDASNS